MTQSKAVQWLSWLIVGLALFAAGVGLFWQRDTGSFDFTTLRGATMPTYGQGLYRYDSLFKGAGARGTDVVTLGLALPLLVVALLLYRRGSARGALLLTGTLAFLLYVYASLALSLAYNELFLVYVALFSASLFAFVLAFAGLQPLAAAFGERLPRRAIALFMLAAGLLTSYVWLEPILGGLVAGQAPRWLEGYATMVTEVLDLGIIIPSAVLAGVMLLRRDPRGYLVAFPLLVILALLLPTIAVQTYLQLAAGVAFTTPEIVGPISGFLVFGLIAVGVIWILLRDL